MPTELAPEALRATCDASRFTFETTAELDVASTIVGQPRATAALQFGLGMVGGGYHIFVAGSPGTGKMTAVNVFLAAAARSRPAPADVCYVYNFLEPERPRVVLVPAGRGRQLANQLKELLRIVRHQLPRAFESDDYTSQRDAIVKTLEQEREKLFPELSEHARAASFALQMTPAGLVLVPLVQGKAMSEADFEALRVDARQSLQETRARLEDEVSQVLKLLRDRERVVRERVEQLDRDVALHTIGGLLDDLSETYADLPAITEYLAAMREDMIAQVDLFRATAAGTDSPAPPDVWQREGALRRYQVNVLVDRGATTGAPVVSEPNPTYQNLVGRIEKEAQFGALVTDFTLIRSGALHRANGGYLVLRAEDVLRQPLSWDALKRALRNRELTIEDAGEWLGMTAIRTLRPEPVPLDLKVVLVGEQATFYLLYGLDPDFSELFRVRADFDLSMPWAKEGEDALARCVATICHDERLRPFDRGALARLVEHAARLAEDQTRLSLQFGILSELVREASYWAGAGGAATVSVEHVRQALAQQVYRSDLVEERLREMIARGTLAVDVAGEVIGQVNGLAVETIGNYSFGHPSRITASVGVGRDGVLDIEREANLGGHIHSKGVLILAGYLIDRFAQGQPLTLSARLAFEQSYGGVDGDSASSAELYAILSCLAGLPLKQSLAVTGSVNQKGQIQAIGGVNEKIEGFFATCQTSGLTGEQGVLIPASNVAHLMLREDVVDAVRDGHFHIYAVKTVDQGLALLTGVPAGERDAEGRYPAETLNARIEARLHRMMEALRVVATPSDGEKSNGKTAF
jgi:lon-related putative ATP-dependent protease